MYLKKGANYLNFETIIIYLKANNPHLSSLWLQSIPKNQIFDQDKA